MEIGNWKLKTSHAKVICLQCVQLFEIHKGYKLLRHCDSLRDNLILAALKNTMGYYNVCTCAEIRPLQKVKVNVLLFATR